ncbi:juxtaposed with another zinc finger protein 1-like [Mytilus trossulus]|uniref:juxtaposed with another zinc finger protein 1-like n=1 Tax=Mytilus trossulus TaxID=6551 RepID=UPI003004A103
MAVFLINECKYLGCGLEFQSLGDLIRHIEDTHIETDPSQLQNQELEQPQSLAPSYILRFYTDADLKFKVRPVSPSSSLRSSTPIGSELDDEDLQTDGYESDDSVSVSSSQELTAPLILSMLTRNPGECDKPIVCPIPGCKKSYKNINGMKYHARNGHKKDIGFIQKAYKCECGKNYKTLHGLKNHNSNLHSCDSLTMKSVTLTKTKDMLIATQIFAPRVLKKEPAIKHVSMAPNIIRQTSTSCQFTNILKLNKDISHEKLKSPVLSMNSMLASEDVHVDVMETSFLDDESQSFITSEQARFQ